MGYIVLLVVYMFFCGIIAQTMRKGNEPFNKKLFVGLFFLGCTLIMGCRGETVGLDTHTYARYYPRIQEHGFFELLRTSLPFDIGYCLLMKITSYFVNDYFFFQFVTSALYCFGMARFIYKNTEHVMVSSAIFLGLGLFFIAFNTQRQFFAVMMVVNAWDMFKDKRYFPAFLLVFGAYLTHSSSIICIFIFIVSKLPNRLLSAVPIIVVLAAVNYKTIVKQFVTTFEEYSIYTTDAFEQYTIGYIYIVWMIVLALSAYLFFKQRRENEHDYISIFSFVYVVTNLVGMEMVYFERIGWFFMPFVMMIFDRVASRLSTDTKYIFSAGVIICFLILSLLTGYGLDYVTF